MFFELDEYKLDFSHLVTRAILAFVGLLVREQCSLGPVGICQILHTGSCFDIVGIQKFGSVVSYRNDEVEATKTCSSSRCAPYNVGEILVCAQAALSDACNASLDDLFPAQFNLSAIKDVLDKSDSQVKATVPSPLVGFTLFVASYAALDSTNGGTSMFLDPS